LRRIYEGYILSYMALSIRNPETDRLARELARATGEDITDAITVAVRERLERLRVRRDTIVEDLMRIARAAPPIVDPRPMDELLGYGVDGLPH
jgi:antitoxin VapB